MSNSYFTAPQQVSGSVGDGGCDLISDRRGFCGDPGGSAQNLWRMPVASVVPLVVVLILS